MSNTLQTLDLRNVVKHQISLGQIVWKHLVASPGTVNKVHEYSASDCKCCHTAGRGVFLPRGPASHARCGRAAGSNACSFDRVWLCGNWTCRKESDYLEASAGNVSGEGQGPGTWCFSPAESWLRAGARAPGEDRCVRWREWTSEESGQRLLSVPLRSQMYRSRAEIQRAFQDPKQM